jgi:hypothetical protein
MALRQRWSNASEASRGMNPPDAVDVRGIPAFPGHHPPESGAYTVEAQIVTGGLVQVGSASGPALCRWRSHYAMDQAV